MIRRLFLLLRDVFDLPLTKVEARRMLLATDYAEIMERKEG